MLTLHAQFTVIFRAVSCTRVISLERTDWQYCFQAIAVDMEKWKLLVLPCRQAAGCSGWAEDMVSGIPAPAKGSVKIWMSYQKYTQI